jgi:hypothetical protein
MPTVLREGGLRLFFYSNEGSEPPHVHVESRGNVAKYWLDPVVLAESHGFRAQELNRLRVVVLANRQYLLERWHEYFGNSI